MPKHALTAAMLMTVAATVMEAGETCHELPGFPARVFYAAETPLEKGSPCELAVLLIHGWGGGVRPGGSGVIRAGAAEAGLPAPYIVQPLFPSRFALKGAKTEDGRARWNDSWGPGGEPGLAADDWRGGGDANGFKLSSFEVIDAIFQAFSDTNRFPNLKRVVLSGFSAGGQFVSRYVAAGRGQVRPGVALDYVAMSPSTEFLFEPGTAWLYGLKDRPRYPAALSSGQIMTNLCSRRVFWACGGNDTGTAALDVSREGRAQGGNRLLRFRHFREHVRSYPEWERQLTFREIPGIAHESGKAYSDPEVRRFLFGRPSVE